MSVTLLMWVFQQDLGIYEGDIIDASVSIRPWYLSKCDIIDVSVSTRPWCLSKCDIIDVSILTIPWYL